MILAFNAYVAHPSRKYMGLTVARTTTIAHSTPNRAASPHHQGSRLRTGRITPTETSRSATRRSRHVCHSHQPSGGPTIDTTPTIRVTGTPRTANTPIIVEIQTKPRP